MKKHDLHYRFIELRAMGNTFERICRLLEITKPTAIKWAKEYKDEIIRNRQCIMGKIFAKKVIDLEQGILIDLEQFRRVHNMNLASKTLERLEQKTIRKLSKLFDKKIKVIQIKMNDDYVTSVTMIFDENLIIQEKKP